MINISICRGSGELHQTHPERPSQQNLHFLLNQHPKAPFHLTLKHSRPRVGLPKETPSSSTAAENGEQIEMEKQHGPILIWIKTHLRFSKQLAKSEYNYPLAITFI